MPIENTKPKPKLDFGAFALEINRYIANRYIRIILSHRRMKIFTINRKLKTLKIVLFVADNRSDNFPRLGIPKSAFISRKIRTCR
jgi:hypothetical protein